MYFYLIGIDYKRTPVNIREAVYWKRGDIAGFLAERSGGHAAAFHTCNRFEVYGTADDVHSARDFVRSFRKRFFPLFETGYAVYEETDVLRHIVRLASGVESQITGELQIYSQLGTWAGRKDTPAVLARLVHEALLATHALRYENGLNKPERNIAVSIYDSVLSKVRSDGLLNIAVVGTGSVAELFASYKPQGVRLVFAARKNITKALELADIAGGGAILLKELPGHLPDIDVLVSATASPHRVFGKSYFSKAALLRKKDLYIYDLSVPRDVEPAVKDIDGVILKNIDEAVSNGNHKDRDKAESFSR